MNIEAISGSATVAIACTFVFLLAAKSWHLVARSMSAHPNFPDAIMREAAQRFRDQLETLSRKQSTDAFCSRRVRPVSSRLHGSRVAPDPVSA
jgi:hypothetical protein